VTERKGKDQGGCTIFLLCIKFDSDLGTSYHLGQSFADLNYLLISSPGGAFLQPLPRSTKASIELDWTSSRDPESKAEVPKWWPLAAWSSDVYFGMPSSG